MHHYFEALTNTSGESLIGYFARVIDPTTQATVTLASDESGTPIATVSGVADMAKTDDYGNIDFYVEPGIYHLDIYATDSTTFRFRVPNVGMQSVQGEQGPQGEKGDPGPAGNVADTLASLKASAIANGTMIYDQATFTWTAGDYTALADDVNYVASNDVAIDEGAWVRQSAAKVQFVQTGSGAVVRPVQDVLRDQPVTPEQFGAVGDGVADDTAALQAALDTGRSVTLSQGKTYLLKARLNLSANDVTVSGGGVIKIAADFDIDADSDGTGPVMRAIFLTGSNCSFADFTFDCTAFVIDHEDDDTGRSHACVWVGNPPSAVADATLFRGVRFLGHPKGAAITCTQYGISLSVVGCYFHNCTGAVFTQGRSSTITGNTCINCTDAAIALNGPQCVGGTVSGNTISMEGDTEIPGMIAVEEGASLWTITGNTLIGCKGSGITCLNLSYLVVVRGGVISNNLVTGRKYDGVTVQTTVNPATLFYISPYYTDWSATGNILRDLPTGNANSRCALVAATGGEFFGNILDARNFAAATVAEISPGNADGITWRDNTSRIATGRHVLFAAGDYLSGTIAITGGRFLGGSTGLDSDTNGGSITNFSASIIDIVENTVSPTLCAMSTYFGDRAAALSGGGYAKPHRLGVFTDMYVPGNTPPSAAGLVPFQTGDTFQYLGCVAGGPAGVKRVVGAFKDYGTLDA
jgi:hypothetical protein